MAATGEDLANEELSFVLKLLGERGKEGEKWKNYTEHVSSYVLLQLSQLLDKTSDNRIRFRPYGSAAEDLKCPEANDVGDVDIMIFSESDNLMIYEELLEYSRENPLHVKIKGCNHPVLQSCLADETEYVATSALKNFHPAIYGNASPYLADSITRAFQVMSREDVSQMLQCSSHIKNSATSPAVTLNFAQSFGTVSEQLEQLKDPQNLPNMDPAEWEWIAHYLCTARGIDYTRQHAEFVNDILKFSNEVQISLQEKGELGIPQTFPVIIQELLCSDKAQKLRARLPEIESGTPIENAASVNNNHPQLVTAENHRDENESGRNDDNVPCVTEADSGEARRATGDLEPTLSKSSMPSNEMSEQATFSPGTDNENEDKRNREYKKDESGGQKGRQPLAQKGELTCQDLPCNADDKEDEKEELQRKIRNGWLDHLFGKGSVEAERSSSRETKSKFTEAAQLHERVGGIDFVPAFRSRGWPKVAREWIKRDRKWPSPEMVDKVIQEGFHLVVKPPKRNGNPDCDFRISFSHAEYLLSQEMNDIQRECYRCLKKYYRAYLSTQPASLVTFHLKNILLQTIEETGAEMWTESNRAKCMMRLLGNVLEALTKKDLRHFFVRSYNLFSVDYIEDPKSLESLAEKVEQIMQNPLQFSKKLITNQEDKKQDKKEENLLSTDPNTSTPGQQHAKNEQIQSEGIADIQCKRGRSTATTQQVEAAQTGSPTTYRYHDLKEIYLDICNELIDMAFNDSDLKAENLDSLERSLVKDLREIVRNHDTPVGDLPRIFNISWDMACNKVRISTEPDMRRRMLIGIQGQVEMMKHMLKQNVAPGDDLEVAVLRMFDPSADDPFDLNHIMPADAVTQFLTRFVSSVEPKPAHKQMITVDDIPLD